MTDRKKRHLSEDARRIFARLSVNAALGRAEIKANPLPHLERAASENSHLRAAIEDALMMLSGADDIIAIYLNADKLAPFASIGSLAVERNRRAYDRLHAALNASRAGH